MADKRQMSSGYYRPARSQPDLAGANPFQPQARIQAQLSQPQVSAHPYPQVAETSSLHNLRPVDNLTNTLSHILEYINRLSVQQYHCNESIAKSDKRFEELLSSVSSFRETADGLTKKLDVHVGVKEALERSSHIKEKEIDVMKVLVGEIKAFKKTLGRSCDGDDGRTVLGRLDAVTFAVGELLERARDPDANLPGPSTPTIVQPCIIDLTRSISPSVGPTTPVHSRTYAEVGTSPVSSPLPLKEKSFASIRASPQCGSGSFSPYPGQSPSAHTFVNDTTTTTPDTASTALTQDNLELAYPFPMDEDNMDSNEPRIDSQTTSAIITDNSEAVSRTQKIPALSNASATTTKTLDVETTVTDVDLSMPSDLASPKDAPNSPISTTLNDKNDNHDLNETPGPGPGIQTFKQPASTVSTSSASPAIIPTAFRQTEVQRLADSSVSEAQQKAQSLKQGLPERLRSPLLTSTCDGGTSLDNVNLERLSMGPDGKSYNEMKIKATKGVEEIKITEKRTSIELDGNRIRDVPAPTPVRIDFSQLSRNRRSSSRVASPSTSLSLFSIRSRTGSRLSISSQEDVTYSSSFPSDTRFSSTKTKALAGAGATTPAAASSPTSVATRTPVTAPIEKASSVSSLSVFRPATTNAISPATPASIFTNQAFSPTTPAVSESSHLESASTSPITDKPLPSPTSTLPVATSAPAVLASSPTTPMASSLLGPLASPAAIFNELFFPSQTSNISQDEVLVSRMIIATENGDNEDNEGEAGNLIEKTAGKIEFKITSEKEEEEKQPARRPLLSLSPLSSLSPSISGSPYHLPVKDTGPSTPRPRCSLFLTPLRSPLASASSKYQTQIDQVPEAPSPLLTPFVTVVRPSSPTTMNLDNDQHEPQAPETPSPSLTPVVRPSSPTTMNLDNDQLEPQSPLFSSPINDISVEQREEEEEGSVSDKLKSPDDENGTANPAISTTASKVGASVSIHIPAQASASIEIPLPRDLSPIAEIEKKKRTVERKDKTQVEKVYTSLGDNADIVRVKKRKVDQARVNPFGQRYVERKGKEIDVLEVKTKSGEAVKKRSLLNLLKFGKKGDSLAVTRVRKRKARPESAVDGEKNGMGQQDDGLDEERPLKRARQRVSDSQMKTEPAEKGKQLSRQSESSFGAGTSATAIKQRSSVSVKKAPPSKGRLSVNGKAEVKWPTIAEEYKDLVGCDNCKAWYHYGCVGLTTGDKRLRGGGKFFCPPCEAGTTIKNLNLYSDCWRPGCTIWTQYIVEKIIGRFKKSVGGKEYQFKYLLQWKGYKLSESSWEPEESMFDPSYMIEKFREDALREGIDIDKEETGIILLQVAKDPSVPQPT